MKGYLTKTSNSEREINSNESYFQILVWSAEGWENLFLTDAELKRIRERAEKNKDMCQTPSWVDKLCKSLGM